MVTSYNEDNKGNVIVEDEKGLILTFPKNQKCKMLDSLGIWGEMEFNRNEFLFINNYEEEVQKIQFWKNKKDKELYIIKDLIIPCLNCNTTLIYSEEFKEGHCLKCDYNKII